MRYVVIDLETTGNSPSKSGKIIEIGMVAIENDEIKETKTTLLNPNQPIPPFISHLTGIHDEEVKDAPLFSDEAEEITRILKDSYIVAHNAAFDVGFLNMELTSNGYPELKNQVLDTVELSRILFPSISSYKLSHLAAHFELHHDDPHRALSDAYVTAKLFMKLKEKLDHLPYETLFKLKNLEEKLQSDLAAILDNRLEEIAFREHPDKQIKHYQGLAFRMSEKEMKSDAQIDISFGEYLDAVYEEQGSLSRAFSSYEPRKGQRQMSETIYDAFSAKKHAFIEAGTGTGKSLAYLLPAVYQAVNQRERLVISTYTTQLQSQLLEEEIPLLRKIITSPFKVALMKGKNHYLNLEKFLYELDYGPKDNYDFVLTKAILLVWITETETGDIDEIQLPAGGYIFFQKVSADVEKIMNPKSPWFHHSYYQLARRRAQKADVVITNHALLCTDMFNDYAFLPSYQKAIIDEAHHFEETASHHYGLKLDYIQMQFTCNYLGTADEDKQFSSVLKASDIGQREALAHKWNTAIREAKYDIDELFHLIERFVRSQQKNDKATSDLGRVQYRIKPETYQQDSWQLAQDMAARLRMHFQRLLEVLSQLMDAYSVDNGDEKQFLEDIGQMQDALVKYIEDLKVMFQEQNEVALIKWAEVDLKGKHHSVFLYSEPADIAPILAEEFFSQKESIIFTSATLTMGSSFTFIKERLGVAEQDLLTEQIASPFQYDKQVQLLIPTDFPDIKYGNIDDFVYAVCEAILSLAEITSGRMLVLFTSYDMLKKANDLLKEMMTEQQYVIIAQGVTSGSRSRLKKNFQSYDQAILLGTSSFWEGVDIPGEDLSALVMARLPFQPPNHPVFEAKSHQMKEEGKNPFMNLSLPQAVIKFKQGFGRLIRSSEDRGIVFICDGRIKTAKYGKYFLESIPSVPVHYEATRHLISNAEEWFHQ
ncbi:MULTISPECIES: ATP-dependent DNA helicase DinG [Oceanobacillus]|uniref:3'-5' exonuclease DinG n=1 Tax=Oceanobacillus aidingensis TaxID=645964 RepID=A0ABV9K291_9BACI|nr:ATP-dependent DNA helicase DinG [Oceanobacillus oncorhynchi]MDM8101578.1 ATP-dependent DNA helicase DinG [Oceanobacillus oncorhynchi]